MLHVDQVVLQGLADCVAPAGKLNRFMASMVNAAKAAEQRTAKRGLTSEGCMQLATDVSQLVRSVAAAQPTELGSADVFRLMTVPKWVEVRLLQFSLMSRGCAPVRWNEHAAPVLTTHTRRLGSCSPETGAVVHHYRRQVELCRGDAHCQCVIDDNWRCVQAVHHPFAGEQQDRMEETWMAWAATCHRGTPEGKAQCLALFTSLQKLHEVPDSGWVRTIKDEVLA